MSTLQFLLFCISLGVVVAVSPSDVTSLITYDCLPDGIVHIHGVPKGYTVTSLIGGSSCHVTQIDSNDFALGRYCTQWEYQNYPDYRYEYHADIQLSHSSSHIVGGNGFNPFRLICDRVHSGGQVFEVQKSMTIRDRRSTYSGSISTLPYARKAEIDRSYQSSPYMYFSSFPTSTTYSYYFSPYTGSLFYLHILSGSSHYSVRPENCTATESPPYYVSSSTESVELWDVTKERCALEPYLMEKFTSTNADQTEVIAPVYAFHFGSRNYYYNPVYFECSVRVCGRGSFSCSLDVCDDVRRKERSAEEEEDDDYEHHVLTGKLTIDQSGSGAERGYSSLLTSVLCVVGARIYRERL